MWYLYFSCLLAWNASHDQQITLSYINYLIKRRGLCACQLFYETTMDKHFILCDLYYGWYVHPNLLHGVIPPLLNYTASTFPSEVSVCDRCRWGFFRGGGVMYMPSLRVYIDYLGKHLATIDAIELLLWTVLWDLPGSKDRLSWFAWRTPSDDSLTFWKVTCIN